MGDAMTTRQEVLHWGEAQLKKEGIADYKTDSWLLYEEVTGINRTAFFVRNQEEMPRQETETYKCLIEKRCLHVPLQYITGRQEFMGMEFKVNENVLIPRFDTEVLVLETEKYLNGHVQILDMCTGSGCIAIALKKRNEKIDVTAIDYSWQALETAKENCVRLGADVCLLHSDLFEIFKQSEQFTQFQSGNRSCRFDIIVSNPPYIPTAEVQKLDVEVRCHEPWMALDGTADGLEFYRRITKESKAFLNDNGMLFYEIGYNQAEAVTAIMESEGFDNIKVVKDLAGLDRVIYGGRKHV